MQARLGQELSADEVEAVHAAASQARDDALILEKKILTRASPLLPDAVKAGLDQTDVPLQGYEQWFGARAARYAAPGAVASMFSPAAYLVAMYREAKALYPQDSPWHIDARRPDLKGLVLNQENLDTPMSALSLSNEILLEKARVALARENTATTGVDVLETLSRHVGSGTPYHHAHNRLRLVHAQKDPGYEQMQVSPQVTKHLSGASLAGIYYDIPPALHTLLIDEITEENAGEKFARYFPGMTPASLLQPARLRDWFDVPDAQLQGFLSAQDDSDYVGRTLAKRVGANIVEVTMSAPSSFINYVRLYPLEDGKWLLNFNLKVSRVDIFRVSGACSVSLTANDFGVTELSPNTEYRKVFDWAQVPESFEISTYWRKSREGGYGAHTHRFAYTCKTFSAASFVLKLNKVIRLYKATGLAPRVLQDIIDSVDPHRITNDTLAVLFRTALLVKRYGISHEDALVMARGLISQTPRAGEMSQFDRLFNDPPLVEGGLGIASKLVKLHPRHSADNAAIKATLKRVCQTDDEGLFELGRALAAGEGEALTVRLVLAQLSGLYTLSLWARLHGLTPVELRQLLDMMGLPKALHAEPVSQWLALLERLYTLVSWLRARHWTVADLLLLTRTVDSIPTSTEITNLLDDMRKVIASCELPEPPETQGCIQALTPLLASAFNLSGETAAQALLVWVDRARPGGLTLVQSWAYLRKKALSAAELKAVTAFVYGLAQRALIAHATGVTADLLALLVEQPHLLLAEAVEGHGSTATLGCSAQSIMALGDCSDWLRTLPDPMGASGAVIAALDAGGVPPSLLAQASGLLETAVIQAASQAGVKGDVENPAMLGSWQEISVVRQWLTLASAFDVMPETLGQMLALDYLKGEHQAWADWCKVADAFLAGLSPSQMQAVHADSEAPLSVALAGFMGARENFTTEQLNQHLLLDSLNGTQVMTSRIAEATAALQMFIHRSLSRPEDKRALRQEVTDRPFFRDWTRWNARYATWSAGQMLMYYPENYIDPTVRLGQTKAMDDMLQVLGQAQINADTVGDAFHGYLSAFEEVANLETVSGYHDSRDPEAGKSWFIGRSRGEPREYWWRTVDEGKRGADGVLAANTWTAWTKIDLAPQVLERLIRPVVYRERLYLGWVERQEHITARDKDGKPTAREWRWSFKLSWLRYDGNWGAPLNYPLMVPDVEALEKISHEKLSLFMASRPGRNGLLVGLYDRSTVSESQITYFAGMEIFEDLSAKPINIGPLLKEVAHWLDAPRHTGMCAVFDGKGNPVAQERLLEKQGSGIPVGFDTFDVALKRARVVDVSPAQGTYSLFLDTLLTVEAKRPEVENKWVMALVRKYPALGKETQTIPTLARSGFGAFMVRKENDQYWGYLCVSRERFERFFSSDYAQIQQVFDIPLPDQASTFRKENTSQGEAYVGRYRVHTGTYPLLHMNIRFKGTAGRLLPVWGEVNLRELLAYPSGQGQDNVTPHRYVDPITKVAAADIQRVIYSANEKEHAVDTAKADLDLSTGAQHVSFTGAFDKGNMADWDGEAQAFHHVQFQCGAGKTRDYTIRVYREADTLKTAVIGMQDNGAQYLARRGWITRLNTLFARTLTERAISGIDTVLSYETQQITEPQIGVTVRLTLPVYKPSYHGADTSAQVWLSTSRTQRTLLWSGELSDTHKVMAQVTFAADAVYAGQLYYHLETKYRARHNTAQSGQSIMIAQGTLTITRSADVGTKLSKDNVDSVQVLDKHATALMDFSGANALYFWELFYYTPMMVMQRFLQEERFDLAEQWLKYVFNPAGYTVRGHYTPRMWNVRPLEEDTSWNDEPLKSHDPDAVAQNDPMHYKLNAFMRLLDIILGHSDAAYRKLERDTLVEAKVGYQRALDLLGNTPWNPPTTHWANPSLGQAASGQGIVQWNAAAGTGELGFLPEVNRMMLGYWEALRIRLYNLRNNLTLDGQPLRLPLYAATADPKALLAAAVAAQAGGERALPPQEDVPALRFIPLLEGARTMASQLIQFGSTLQGILERQDAEALAELLNSQGAELAASSVDLQKQTLKELAAERVTLEASLQSATLRRDHYRALYEENVNAREMQALDLSTAAQTFNAAAKVPFMAGAVLEGLPNIFGFANGGHRPGQLVNAVGIGYTLYADALNVAASRIGQEESYRRRRQDWEIQHKSAEQEMAVIQAQLDALAVRETSANMQIAHMQTQSAHAQAQLALLRGKFTGKKMYSWLRARLATIFYTYYDLTASRCMMAQKALQWEKGDTTSYLRTGTWNGAWAGLLCGEGLMLALGQMENAWMKWQKRELEVTRTVSLAKLFDGRLTAGGQAVSLNGAVKALIDGKSVVVDKLPLSSLTLARTGDLSVQFGLKELGLVAGFENNAMRRVRRIAVTLPALLGPYQDVRARLRTSATGLPAGCNESAISHGMQDGGVFAPDGADSHPRWGAQWLPFEGLSIASASETDDKTVMTLNFADAKGEQKALLQSLSDIILHVQYTVR
ncbi:Tc toxin subunit A [Pseudomonas sp. p1(2021b)]|uniref:Tc toxin subunit A-related protein n=1 Tax=Pseudomonas sp. p1(2021b) TaxID=2874628 RepID=UPI001CCB39E9|nr:neuraminidase-like domain-containing protein [Pseudomonas sp. p1(2021b)]UBM27352.1 Tc toxin subunit A [Pseudomonas sp. p1(2021b)]